MALTARMVRMDCADPTGRAATVRGEQAVGGFAWTTLADLEGSESCVSGRG
jgi:hypothetical protein